MGPDTRDVVRARPKSRWALSFSWWA